MWAGGMFVCVARVCVLCVCARVLSCCGEKLRGSYSEVRGSLEENVCGKSRMDRVLERKRGRERAVLMKEQDGRAARLQCMHCARLECAISLLRSWGFLCMQGSLLLVGSYGVTTCFEKVHACGRWVAGGVDARPAHKCMHVTLTPIQRTPTVLFATTPAYAEPCCACPVAWTGRSKGDCSKTSLCSEVIIDRVCDNQVVLCD